MTYEDLQDALFRWFQAAAGEQVVWENQNAPRPPGDFLSLFGPRLVREAEPLSWQGQGLNEGRDVEQVTALAYSVYITVTEHGCDAMNRAWRLHQRLYTDSPDAVIAPLQFIEAEDITQIPQLLESQFEPRAQFTARFRLTTYTIVAVPVVQTVTIIPCTDIGGHYG